MGAPPMRPPGPPMAGPPPAMPGLPPGPTGVGPMQTGSVATDKKTKASNAVMALRELKGDFPNLGMAIDGIIQQIVAAGKPGGDAASPSPNAGIDASAPAPGGAPLIPPGLDDGV